MKLFEDLDFKILSFIARVMLVSAMSLNFMYEIVIESPIDVAIAFFNNTVLYWYSPFAIISLIYLISKVKRSVLLIVLTFDVATIFLLNEVLLYLEQFIPLEGNKMG